jgi:hypothetical protein
MQSVCLSVKIIVYIVIFVKSHTKIYSVYYITTDTEIQ